MAKAIYLKEIHAGNSGQQPHTVVTFEGTKEKHLKTNNARFGFLISSNRLLEKIVVNFQGSVLRSYTFAYKEGAFHKDILTGVKHLDDAGTEVSYQNFDYYDDVQSDKGYVPFKNKQEVWNTQDDNLNASFITPFNPFDVFSNLTTALGGSSSSSAGGGLYAGVGPDDNSPFSSNTIDRPLALL